MLDLSPQNLMSDPIAGLKVLDLEFVMPYTNFAVPAPSAAGRLDLPCAAPRSSPRTPTCRGSR